MTTPLEVSIARLPSVTGQEPGPQIVVGPADQGVGTADLYRRLSASAAGCRAGQPIVAIVSTGVLNTPDQVSATGTRRDGGNFDVNLEIRRYDGPMAANDPWLALIRTELGSLRQGAYRLTLHETSLRFTDIRRPDTAGEPMRTERSFDFACIDS